MGVWADESYSWLDGDGWSRKLELEVTDDGHLLGKETHEHGELGIRLDILEGIPEGDTDSFQRHIQVTNLRDQARDVRLFITHDLRIMEGDIGDCVLWHPALQGLIHFKGDCAVLLRAEGSDRYACGITEFGGAEGTWRDAEDGELSMSPIAQGSVDSTLGVPFALAGHASGSSLYEIVFARSIDALERVGNLVLADHAQAPSNESDLHIAIIRSQISETGAILAANDSDIMATNRANYSYCWVRDGAHVAEILSHWDGGITRENFINWALPLLEHRPYIPQKYRADGTFGASWHPWTRQFPIQLDETASFVSLLAHSATDRKDTIRRCAEFLLQHQEDGLPNPSYDLWEEGWGTHIYTVATVIRALRDAGHDVHRMTKALCERFFHNGYFRRTLSDDRPDSASLYVGLLGILPIDDPMVQSNAHHVREALWVHEGVGGLARYSGDYYFRQNDRHPGNPWIICTLWLAQHEAMSGRPHRAHELLDWVRRHADPTGVLPEQVHPETGAPLSVSPLTWSHAEFLKTLSLLG